MKIGIFGGTFNPIHSGHLSVAEAAKNEYGLERVVFITSGNPPHKRASLDAKFRHIMVRLAIRNIDGFVADDFEVKKESYSYSVETLKYFKSIYPDDELYFIIGGDSMRDFTKWYKPYEIVRLANILVYEREGFEPDIPMLEKELSTKIGIIKGKTVDVSSTEIRKGEKTELLPLAVAEFIDEYKIYKYTENDIEAIVKSMLDEKRFLHTVGVAEEAKRLAEIHGENPEKAYTAGILHDIAKSYRGDAAKKACKALEVELDSFEENAPELVHAKLGAELVRCMFPTVGDDIVSAVRWHTVGRGDMTLLEKIVFVADMTEKTRDFGGVDRLREIAQCNINEAAAECAMHTAKYLEKLGKPVHPNCNEVIKSIGGQR